MTQVPQRERNHVNNYWAQYFLQPSLSVIISWYSEVSLSIPQGLIVSLLLLGALVGALVAGVIAESLGRKPAIIIGACMAFGGAAFHTGAIHLG